MPHTLVPTFLDTFLENAARRPDKLAFEITGEGATYGEMVHRIRSAAHALEQRGLSPGTRSAVVLPTSLDAVIAILASQWTGGAPVVVDSSLPPGLLSRRLAMVRPSVVICEPRALSRLSEPPEAGNWTWTAVEELAISPGVTPNRPHQARADRPAYLQLTSGTQGEPKAAVISHAALAHFLRIFQGHVALTPEDICITWVPLYHDYGLVHFLFYPLYVGCEGHLLPPGISSFSRWLREVGRLRATVTGGPDFGYRIASRMVKPESVDLSSLRWAGSGGEPVRPDTLRRFRERFNLPNPISPAYGQAETTLAICGPQLGEPIRTDASGHVANGRPFPGVEVRIADERGQALPAGEIGQIHVKGPYLFDGYFEDPEATDSVFVGDWLDTGDTGYLDAEGYLFILGRRRAMIKRGGALIAPREVEEAAERVAGVRRTAAIGAPEGAEGLTEKIVLLAEIAPGHFPTREERRRLAEVVATEIEASTGHPPGDVILVKPGSIERTPNGKTRYPTIRQRYLDNDFAVSGALLFPLPEATASAGVGQGTEDPET